VASGAPLTFYNAPEVYPVSDRSVGDRNEWEIRSETGRGNQEQRDMKNENSGEGGSGTSRSQGAADPGAVLKVIYVALALGVGVLAVVFYLVGPAASGAMDRSLFRWIWLAVAVVCTIGAGAVHGRSRAMSADGGSVLPAAVVAWSLAEAQALLAAIGFFLTGDLALLVAGLVLFVFLFARHRPSVFLGAS
jgi:hypothetical protein